MQDHPKCSPCSSERDVLAWFSCSSERDALARFLQAARRTAYLTGATYARPRWVCRFADANSSGWTNPNLESSVLPRPDALVVHRSGSQAPELVNSAIVPGAVRTTGGSEAGATILPMDAIVGCRQTASPRGILI